LITHQLTPTVPETFDIDATTDQLDPTWKAQVDWSRLNSTWLRSTSTL